MPVVVQELLNDEAADLQLVFHAGQAGLHRKIQKERIQKPGLALTGFNVFVHSDRVQILGSTELAYLSQMSPEDRKESSGFLCEVSPVCIICTKGMAVPKELIEQCNKRNVPLMSTPQLSSIFISRIQNWLADRLAPKTSMHGVLMDVFGVGALVLGQSGIGKSECALELIQRGHRLVADDIVQIKKHGMEFVYGAGTALLKHHIEIRGLGILDIKEMFGVSSVVERKRIDLVAEMVMWRDDEEYDRLGIEERRFPILDVELPLITVPVRPGRNMGSIIEVAARNQLLKSMGTHSAVRIHDRLNKELALGRRNTFMGDNVE